MDNLIATMTGLDACRFYTENMVHIQFGNPLCAVPPEPPYNQPINARNLHQMIGKIYREFDAAIIRSDLEFPIQGILYRFRSIYGNYAAQYKDDLVDKPVDRTAVLRNPVVVAPPVPEQGADEDIKAFSYRFLAYTADQVRGFIWMVSLDQYGREQTDHFLPGPPWAFKQPDRDGASAFLSAHHDIVSSLMMAMLTTHSDTLDIHDSLREYGLSTVFPLVAECRNVIYDAWTIPNAKGQKANV